MKYIIPIEMSIITLLVMSSSLIHHKKLILFKAGCLENLQFLVEILVFYSFSLFLSVIISDHSLRART